MATSSIKIIHVSAWAKTFTQFRMPLLNKLRECFKQIIYCPYEKGHTEKLIEDGFEVVNNCISPRIGVGLISQILMLYGYLKRECCDVIITHQPMGTLVGMPAAKLAKVPVRIYSTGGIRYYSDKMRAFNKLMKYFEHAIIRWSSAVLLVTREDEVMLQKCDGVGNKAFYVGPRGGCGVNSDTFNPKRRLMHRERARNDFGLNKEHFVVGFAGRCVWEKGFKELIDAAALLKQNDSIYDEIRYLIIGKGQHFSEIKDCIGKKGLDSQFILTGYKESIDYFMSAFDVFVLPSYREGMSVSLLEAMALGIPSISTDIRGNRELIEDGKTGILIPVRNSMKLAEAIMIMRDSPEKADEMSICASEHVLKNYNEDILLDNTMNIISKLIGKEFGNDKC